MAGQKACKRDRGEGGKRVERRGKWREEERRRKEEKWQSKMFPCNYVNPYLGGCGEVALCVTEVFST